MSNIAQLTPQERARGQRAAVFYTLFANVSLAITMGPIMALYATDVLGFSAKAISIIMALLPAVALLRLFVLDRVRRLGLLRTLRAASFFRFAIVVIILVIPSSVFTDRYGYILYTGLLVLLSLVWRVGSSSVWQPLLREITTDQDRGRFFARMRFWFTVVTTTTMALIPLFVGQTVTGFQYKCLLAVAAVGVFNSLFWSTRFPKPSYDRLPREQVVPRTKLYERLFIVLRTSSVFRYPVLIVFLISLGALPIYVVYLKQLLHIPSNIVSLFVWTMSFGGALSLLFWGRLADTIGFRPMLKGLLVLAVLIAPLQLLLAPFPESGIDSIAAFSRPQFLTVGVLLINGLVGGAVTAGTGIATTSILHYHTKGSNSLEALNLFMLSQMLLVSMMSLVGGWLLQEVAIPAGSVPVFGGLAEFDWIKGYLIGVGIPTKIAAILLLSKLRNARPHFGMVDFFQSFTSSAIRGLLVQRHIYHADHDRRTLTAEWLGTHSSPMSIDALTEMLHDPSYDVKVAAIRALARSNSPLAGDKLLELFQTPEKNNVADHAAWALGELQHEPAIPALLDHIDSVNASRIRAMSARALAKMNVREAIPVLVDILQTPQRSEHVLSSACWALLKLDDNGECADLCVDVLARLTDREERYEVADAFCGHLALSNEWLLRYTNSASTQEAIVGAIAEESAAWRSERERVCRAAEDRDKETIEQEFGDVLGDFEEPHPLLLALQRALRQTDRWRVLHVVAAAWLLWRPQ